MKLDNLYSNKTYKHGKCTNLIIRGVLHNFSVYYLYATHAQFILEHPVAQQMVYMEFLYYRFIRTAQRIRQIGP